MRVAVTGARGRLGRALVAALEDAPFAGPFGPIAWDRAAFDLDAPAEAGALLERDRPETVVHAAAWTDVDGCARDPGLALARNGTATGILATACAERGIDLIVVSTNEVFDGRRTDGRGYLPTDDTAPLNPYGASKLAGERAATDAYEGVGASGALGIVRTAWLYGPPGNDFPSKILAAAERLDSRRRATAPRRRRDRLADLHPRRGGGDRGSDRRGRYRRNPPRRQRRGRIARGLGTRAPAAGWSRCADHRRPGIDLDARVDPAGLGSPGTHRAAQR